MHTFTATQAQQALAVPSPPISPQPPCQASSSRSRLSYLDELASDPIYLSLSSVEVAEICVQVVENLLPAAPRSNRRPSASNSTRRSLYLSRSNKAYLTATNTDDFDESESEDEDIPSLRSFIANALWRTKLPAAIPLSGLVLLKRFAEWYPSATGVSTSAHRLFLASFMISAKLLQDNSYSNKSWVTVSGNLFTLAEVGMMEKELASFLGWDLRVTRLELDSYILPLLDVLSASVPSPRSLRFPAPFMPTSPAAACPVEKSGYPLESARGVWTPMGTPDMVPASTNPGRHESRWSASTAGSDSSPQPSSDEDDAGPPTPAERSRRSGACNAVRRDTFGRIKTAGSNWSLRSGSTRVET